MITAWSTVFPLPALLAWGRAEGGSNPERNVHSSKDTLMSEKQTQESHSAILVDAGKAQPVPNHQPRRLNQHSQEPAAKRPHLSMTLSSAIEPFQSSNLGPASEQRVGTKSVSFHIEMNQTHRRASFSDEEFRACWLSPEELLEIRKLVEDDIVDFRRGTLPLLPNRTIRGLETKAVKGMSALHSLKIQAFRSSILERQRLFGGLPSSTGGVPNPLSISTFSADISADDVKKAIERAADDEKEAMLEDSLC